MEEITKLRLAWLREATLRWNSTVARVVGAKNKGHNVLYCRSVEEDTKPEIVVWMATYLEGVAMAVCPAPITLGRLNNEEEKDYTTQLHKRQIQCGFSEDRKLCRVEL